ncbi:MAG: ion transporter [Hylemonella sp.]|nr:ion transporter [Hylemonella sp.]
MAHEGNNLLDRPLATRLIVFLILYSVVCFSIETLPDLDADTRLFLQWSEMAVVALFTCEYLYRIYVAEHRLRFIFSLPGLIDLLAVLPFYLALAIDLRTLRLLRLLRVAKLLRYSKALQRFGRALYLAREELLVFLVAILVLLYLSAFGIYQFEHAAQPEKYASIFDALWWAVATITTVGYGDLYPITTAGRLFTFVILVLGLGMVAVPAGIIASALSAIRGEDVAAAQREEKPPS